MTKLTVEVQAAQEPGHLDVRLYGLALLALARQLAEQPAEPDPAPVRRPEVERA